jgi:hypothetical protein
VNDVIHTVARNYPAIAAELLAPLLDLLQISRHYCGGDMDKFLVVLVAALRTVKHPEFRAASPELLSLATDPVLPSLGTNARSIAASLGIPKETIRRKVTELIEDGWLARIEGRLYCTAACYNELAPVRAQIEQLAAANYRVVAALLERRARA